TAGRRVAEAGFTTAQFQRIDGCYVDLESGEWLTLRMEDGVLRGETLGDPLFLYHAGDRVFRDGDDYRATVPVELRLDQEREDVVCRLTLGGQSMTLRKCSDPLYSREALEAYVGAYEDSITGCRLRVRIESGLQVDYGLG